MTILLIALLALLIMLIAGNAGRPVTGHNAPTIEGRNPNEDESPRDEPRVTADRVSWVYVWGLAVRNSDMNIYEAWAVRKSCSPRVFKERIK